MSDHSTIETGVVLHGSMSSALIHRQGCRFHHLGASAEHGTLAIVGLQFPLVKTGTKNVKCEKV